MDTSPSLQPWSRLLSSSPAASTFFSDIDEFCVISVRPCALAAARYSVSQLKSTPEDSRGIQSMSENSGVTTFEFIGLLACSILGGLLTGVFLVWIFLRYEKHCVRRAGRGRQNRENDTEGDSVISIKRESDFLPIQEPPREQTPSPSSCHSSFSFHEWRHSHNDRLQNSNFRDGQMVTDIKDGPSLRLSEWPNNTSFMEYFTEKGLLQGGEVSMRETFAVPHPIIENPHALRQVRGEPAFNGHISSALPPASKEPPKQYKMIPGF